MIVVSKVTYFCSHVISTSGSLVVMDTKLEDQGTYRAVISNGAGTVTVESSLEFFFGE